MSNIQTIKYFFYWIKTEEGNSALSTIEAIAYTAKGAGLSDEDYNTLTLLFQLQRYRVLTAIGSQDHRTPRAISVSGQQGSLGDWKAVEGYNP